MSMTNSGQNTGKYLINRDWEKEESYPAQSCFKFKFVICRKILIMAVSFNVPKKRKL